MNPNSSLGLYLRITLISLFIAVMGLTPMPRAASRHLIDARLAIDNGESQSAATNLAKAAEYFPWRYELNISAANYAMQSGDPASTINYLERPGTISHLAESDRLLLADAYLQAHAPLMAISIWSSLVDLNKSLPAARNLADYYLKQRDYLSAASYLQQLIVLDPSNKQLYYQVGVHYAVIDPTRALPFLVQAAEMDPAHASHARALHDEIRTANLFDEPVYTLLMVGRQLADWGDWQMAFVAFRQAVSLSPEYADAWAFLSEAKQQVTIQETGAVSRLGLPELELALQLDPSSVLANTLMAMYWERQGEYSQAGRYLDQAITTSPQDPYLYAELGNVYSKAGDLPTAQAAYERAIQVAPRDALFYRQLAQFAMDNNIQVRELALPAARKAILIDPQDPSSLDLMAQVMLLLLDYQSAERFSLSAIHSDPHFAPAYLHLGTAYLYQGRSDLARHWLTETGRIDPDSWAASQASRMLEYYLPN